VTPSRATENATLGGVGGDLTPSRVPAWVAQASLHCPGRSVTCLAGLAGFAFVVAGRHELSC